MLGDYGCDDMSWLIEHSGRPDAVKVATRGATYFLPIARFDNRTDKTTFVRGNRAKWKKDDVAALHRGLSEALAKLAGMSGAGVS
jgi:hypothetical protein